MFKGVIYVSPQLNIIIIVLLIQRRSTTNQSDYPRRVVSVQLHKFNAYIKSVFPLCKII